MKSKDIDIVDFARFVGLLMVSKGYGVSQLKLQKVVFYCQAWFMVYFDKTLLFPDAPEAWVDGPTYRKVYEAFKGTTKHTTDDMCATDFCPAARSEAATQRELRRLADALGLTNDEMYFVDSVISLYGTKTDAKLIALTHCEKPWIAARGDIAPFASSRRELNLGDVFSYYDGRRRRKLGADDAHAPAVRGAVSAPRQPIPRPMPPATRPRPC